MKTFSLENLATWSLVASRTQRPDDHARWLTGPFPGGGLLVTVIFRRMPARAGILLLSLASSVCFVAAPYYQKLFIDALRAGEVAKDSPAVLITWGFVATLAGQLFSIATRIVCVRESTIAQRRLSDVLYAHTLSLTGRSRDRKTIGEMVALFATDVTAVVALLDDFLPSIINSVIPFLVAPVALTVLFRLPLLPCLLIIGGSALLLGLLSVRQSSFFARFKSLAAERLAYVNEWLQNMRVLRILGWTESFEAKIFRKRIEETHNRLGMVTNGSTINSIAQVAPLAFNIVGAFTLIALRRDTVTPGEVFGLFWILTVFLARPVRALPWTFVIFLDGLTSARRLERYLALASEGAGMPLVTLPAPTSNAIPPTLVIEGLTLEIDGRRLLHDLSFVIPSGQFVAIVGEVGSGKSLLLSSLLRETAATFRRYELSSPQGSADALTLSLADLRCLYAFAPQDGFIMSSTLRDNVAFEYHTTEDADDGVRRALETAQFTPGRENLAGLETEIGERGVNLSGGQRQRVALARALYAERPVVLLDDSLSAVDEDTERGLMSDLLLGAWAGRTRLLVTHRLSVLPFVDRVLVLDEGRIIADGPYDVLRADPRVSPYLHAEASPATNASGKQAL